MVPKELLAFGTTVKKKESALYGETALAGLQTCQKGALPENLHFRCTISGLSNADVNSS